MVSRAEVCRRQFEHYRKYEASSAPRKKAVEAPAGIGGRIDERTDRGETLTEQDWLDAEYIDKGTAAAPVIEEAPAAPEPAPAPAPEPAKAAPKAKRAAAATEAKPVASSADFDELRTIMEARS